MTTPANTLTPGQIAGIVLVDNPTIGLSASQYSAVSADPAIANIVDPGGGTLGVHYVSDGLVDVVVTRLSDNSTVLHTITCTSGNPSSWDWQLGAVQ